MVYAENKGRHWVPLLIMLILTLCCTALFYAVPMETTMEISSQESPWFSVTNGILYFDKSKYTGSSELTVPDKIDGAVITAISEGCFRDCGELTEIHLPDTLNAIGEEAFSGCTGLRGIEVPASVVFVGKGAFSGCSALEAACISNNLQHIGTGAFDGCTNFHYVYFLGDFREWTTLYRDFIGPKVVISCDDGKFYQSGDHA